MINYQNGKIYKIVSAQTDKIYVGSTTKKYLSSRMAEHRSLSKKTEKKQCTSNRITQYSDAKIVLLESYPCNSKDELLARERYWIEQLKELVINMFVPFTTKDEKKNNKKKLQNEYYERNKERVLQRNKEKKKCECGAFIGKYEIKRQTHLNSKKHQEYISALNNKYNLI